MLHKNNYKINNDKGAGIMTTVTITRRSRNIGWEYSTSVVDDGYGGWKIESPTEPYYIGTVKQVLDSIEKDRTFASIKSGGTYYSTAWFVKVNNQWHKVDTERGFHPAEIIATNWETKEYLNDSIELVLKEQK